LSGHWREDHLFSLRQGLKMYDAIQQRITEYDGEILRKLAAMQREGLREQPPPKVKNPQKARAIKKRGEEPMREALFRMSGVDLTTIDALGVETVQVVLSEYGPDLSRFPTEKKFVSHVTLTGKAGLLLAARLQDGAQWTVPRYWHGRRSVATAEAVDEGGSHEPTGSDQTLSIDGPWPRSI
jgi:hypothetical protein